MRQNNTLEELKKCIDVDAILVTKKIDLSVNENTNN